MVGATCSSSSAFTKTRCASSACSIGRGAQTLAEAMLTHGLGGCIASDAHRPDVRTPELLSAWDNLAEHFSERLSEQLLTRNPELILRSEPLPAGRFRPFF